MQLKICKKRHLSSLIFPFMVMVLLILVLQPEWGCAQRLRRLNLIECLEIAIEKNPQLKSAEERLVRSRLQIREAYSSIYPKLSSDFTYTHQNDPPSYLSSFGDFPFPEDNYSLSLSLQQPLFDQGKYRVLKPQAELGIEIARLGLESARQNIFLGVISAYLQTLKAEEMLIISRESRDRLLEHLRVTKRRFEVGQVPKNDVLRAEMELANAESDQIHAEKDISLAYENLQKILFIEGETFSVIPVRYIRQEEMTMEDMIARAYQKRPDYIQALKTKEVARKGISLAKTDFFPTVSLFGEYEWSGDEFFPEDDVLVVGGSIRLPIFEGGIRSVKLRRAHHDYTLSEYEEAEIKKQIRVEVIEAFLHLEDLLATLRAIDKQIEHAEENMRIVRLRYQEGEATNLDVLDANLLLVKARTDFVNINYDIIGARFGIDRAIGELSMERIRHSLGEK
ncbi:MAG: TolC family protein, partial [bacterium]